MTVLSHPEKRDWLRLARTQNVGPVTFAALVARFGSATAALAAVPRLAKRGGATSFKMPSADDAEEDFDALAKLGGVFIASCEENFPPGLAAIDPPPPILAVLGNADLLSREAVAIVGARNASALGRKFAATLASELGRTGLMIVSGMARGIDAAAHEASLGTGTCAVLAGGIDVIYPPEHRALYDRIRAEGAVVSEMPIGEAPLARHFPRRNRIISGISRGVIVIEAAENSGSLITATYALEQGREVFSVPGSPLDPRSRGTNRLIRQGATLTESAEDVLEIFRPMMGNAFREPEQTIPGTTHLASEAENRETENLRRKILELLSPSPITVDDLIQQCCASAADLLAVLLELELAGYAQRQPGNRVSLA
jgi:DNA processing protein